MAHLTWPLFTNESSRFRFLHFSSVAIAASLCNVFGFINNAPTDDYVADLENVFACRLFICTAYAKDCLAEWRGVFIYACNLSLCSTSNSPSAVPICAHLQDYS